MKETFARLEHNPGAVINTDNSALAAYKLKKQRERAINTMQEEINTLRASQQQTNQLLQLILEKLNK